jgi:hypothetical protein
VECPTFQRRSQSIRRHFRRKVSFGDDIADFFSAFDKAAEDKVRILLIIV